MVALGSTVLALFATTTIAPVGGPLERPPHIGERSRVSAPDKAVADLVAAARRADRAAYAELYQRFARAVHAVVLARASYRDAGDLVQDVFVIALERLGQLSDPAAF